MTIKRAVVTGASSGIGRATVVLLRERGWDVVGVARREDRLAELAAETGAHTVTADVTVAEDVERVREAVEELGGASVLVCNAGGAIGLDPVESASPEDWKRMFDVNVIGTQRMIAALLPSLRASTTDGGGASIVGVTSIAGHRTYEGGGGYNAAKHAQRAVLEVLRLELSGEPIRVVEVAPGMVHTEEFSLNRFGGDKARADAVYDNVANPLVAEDIAEVIAHAIDLPPHVDLDTITVKPVAQAAPHKVARGELRAKG
jgi:NADP-dependent 3-hydroxy acid dehydrogenase YdfG